MLKPSPELIIFVFGILSTISGLQHLPDVKTKQKIFRILFAVGFSTQLLAHSFQFSYAMTNRVEAQKEVEAATAIALYAYTENNVPLLKATSKESYLVGYRIFKNRELEE